MLSPRKRAGNYEKPSHIWKPTRVPGRIGFFVSAKRKFADALERVGETGEANAQHESAMALAR